MRIAIDIDGVIARSDARMKRIIRDDLGIEVPWDRPPGWRLEDWGLGLTARQRDYLVTFYRDPEFYLSLEPFEGASAALRRVAEVADSVYLTARPASVADATFDWLRTWGFPPEPICFAKDKVEAAREFKVDLAIEDAPKHLRAYHEAGIPALRFAAPYNEGEPGHRVEGWAEALALIEEYESFWRRLAA
jgi:uncharacterized HAD superfamily protein